MLKRKRNRLYHPSERDLTGLILSQGTTRNQLPVIKKAVSATIQDLIGYFPENS